MSMGVELDCHCSSPSLNMMQGRYLVWLQYLRRWLAFLRINRRGRSLLKPRILKQSQYLALQSLDTSVLPQIYMVRGLPPVIEAELRLPPGKQLSTMILLLRLRQFLLGCQIVYFGQLLPPSFILNKNNQASPHQVPLPPINKLNHGGPQPRDSSYYDVIYLKMMSNPQVKKKVTPLQLKKTLTLPQAIKCYVCSQHFQSQNQFDVHFRQHQSKLKKQSIDEMQRKTQESFRRNKATGLLNRTQSAMNQEKEKPHVAKVQDKPAVKQEEVDRDKEEQEIEEALRQSQILLQKLDFITQVSFQQQERMAQKQQKEETEHIQKSIYGEQKLYKMMQHSEQSSWEQLILQTDCSIKYFQNYQEQLIHLRILTSAAFQPASKAKIADIRRKIVRDVWQELKQHFQVVKTNDKLRGKVAVQAELSQNEGDVKFCADCLSEIGGMSDLYELQCGHCYHPECWNGQCCS